MILKTRISIAFIILMAVSSGCMKMAIKKYKVNRPLGNISKQEYLSVVSSENAVDPDLFLYLDSASYMSFASTSSGSLYYGCFINDSVSIKKTDFLLDNESCIGRISKEIEKIVISKNIDSFARDTLTGLGQFNFLKLGNDQKVELVTDKKKLSVVLVYIYAYGIYYKSLYKEIIDVCKKYQEYCDLHIVSLDPIYSVKK